MEDDIEKMMSEEAQDKNYQRMVQKYSYSWSQGIGDIRSNSQGNACVKYIMSLGGDLRLWQRHKGHSTTSGGPLGMPDEGVWCYKHDDLLKECNCMGIY